MSVVIVGWMNHRKINEVAAVVKQVDRAVNGKDPRDSTLSEDVIRIRDKQELDLPSGGEAALLPMVKALSISVANLERALITNVEPKE